MVDRPGLSDGGLDALAPEEGVEDADQLDRVERRHVHPEPVGVHLVERSLHLRRGRVPLHKVLEAGTCRLLDVVACNTGPVEVRDRRLSRRDAGEARGGRHRVLRRGVRSGPAHPQGRVYGLPLSSEEGTTSGLSPVARTRIWPCLSYMCRPRSRAEDQNNHVLRPAGLGGKLRPAPRPRFSHGPGSCFKLHVTTL